MALCAVIPSLHATPLEDWQFEDTEGTDLPSLANSAGSASFAGAAANAQTDDSGNLSFTVGVDAADNIFRNATVSNPNQTEGEYELAFEFVSADLSTGDITGANVGFGIRDDSNNDLFLVRLHKQNGTVRLQTRVGNTNTDLEDFGGTSVSNLSVRVVFDLGNDRFDVYWSQPGSSEKCSTNIPMSDVDLELDIVRLLANTNTDDWGATDQIDVGYLTLSSYTAPAPAVAIEDFQFTNDGRSLNDVANDAGTANLGGAADNALTSGGSLVFSQGADASDTIFRNSPLTNPNQDSGQFLMEWEYSSATLAGGDLTGANVGFGMRDEVTNSDLFLVRLQRQNGTLRLQHRVGSTNTDLENFNVDTLSEPLYVRVLADLESDTFHVFWQLGDGIGQCAVDIPMSAPDLEFDWIRVAASTGSDDWGATDEVAVNYLTIRDLSVVATELELSIVAGPGADEVTLIWPTSTPAGAVLEESTDLGISDAWEEVIGSPTVNGANNELTVTTGTRNFYRLSTEP